MSGGLKHSIETTHYRCISKIGTLFIRCKYYMPLILTLFKHCRHASLTLLVLSAFCFSPLSFSADTIRIQNDPNFYETILPYMEYAIDPTRELTLEDIRSPDFSNRFQQFEESNVRFFMENEGNFWFRLTVHNDSPNFERFWLELANLRLDKVTLFTTTDNGVRTQIIGDQVTTTDLRFKERLNTLRLNLAANQTNTFYIEISNLETTPFVFFTPRLATDHTQTVHLSSINILLGIFYGIVIALLVYTLNIYFSLKDKSFLYFIALLITGMIQIASAQGVVKVLFNGHGELINLSTSVSYTLVIVATTLFTSQFLQLQYRYPKLNKLALIIGFATLPVVLGMYHFNPAYLNISIIWMGTISSTVLMMISLKCYANGYRPAVFLFLGFLSFFLPMMFLSAITESIYPALSRDNLLSIALVAQLIAMTCGLSSRIDSINIKLSHEIKQRKQREEQLTQAQTIARYGDWYWELNAVHPHLSPTAIGILPSCINTDENIYTQFYSRIHDEDKMALNETLESARATHQSFEQEVRIEGDNDDIYYYLIRGKNQIMSDNKSYLVGTIHDISEDKRHEQQLKNLGHYDSLTGLANRTLFHERLQHALNKSVRAPQNHALLFIDLDQFKNINDSLGHDVGDKLLIEVANRLRQQTRLEDTVARLGGDEFAILIEDVPAPRAASSVAEHILDAMSAPVVIDGYNLIVTPSIGIAMHPDNGKDMNTLIRKADTAMYFAKSQGRNNYQFFTDQLNEKITRKLDLEAELRLALPNQELFVSFQPKVNLKTGSIVGAEALLRWESEKYGIVSPVEFISLAEETGLIWPIGEFVLQESCEQAKVWLSRYPNFGSIAVNISGLQFNHVSLFDTVKRVLEDTGLPAHHLELEITENAIIENAEEAMVIMRRLRGLGVKLSLDDFGTGYSSLKYLKRFPVDSLKIDRSFVAEIVSNGTDRRIAANIVNLAHELKLNVVAEGVESLEQLAVIESMNCDELQGYIFSPAVSSAEMSDMLENDDNLAYHVPELDRYDQLELIAK